MAEISDLERGLDGTRAAGRSAFPPVEARQEAPNLASGETIESASFYSRSRDPSEEPITSRGLAKLPAGVRMWSIRDAEGQSSTSWAEPIYEEEHSSRPDPTSPSTSPIHPPVEETGRPKKSERMANRYVVAVQKQPAPKEKRQDASKPEAKPPRQRGPARGKTPAQRINPELPYTVTFDLGNGEEQEPLDPAEETRKQWQRRLRYLTEGEWVSLRQAMEKRIIDVPVPGMDVERQHTALFYLALLGVISTEEFESLAASATTLEVLESLNPSKVVELAFKLFEFKETMDSYSEGAIDVGGGFYLVQGQLRPEDIARRQSNAAFRQVFYSDKVKRWNVDEDTLIEKSFYRRQIIKEVLRR